MKKLISMLFICCMLASCSKQTSLQSSFKNDFDVIIQPKEIEEIYDDHGGFHGDGESLIKIHLDTPPDILDWNDCPLPSDLATKIYNNSIIESSLLNEIFQITNGKYQFINKNSSANYSFALFDEEDQCIYYYRFDS